MHSTLQKHHALAGVALSLSKGLFAGLAAASIWGGMYVVSKIVFEVIPPFVLLTIRLVMGAMTLGIAIYFRNKRAIITGRPSTHDYPTNFMAVVSLFIDTQLPKQSRRAHRRGYRALAGRCIDQYYSTTFYYLNIHSKFSALSA